MIAESAEIANFYSLFEQIKNVRFKLIIGVGMRIIALLGVEFRMLQKSEI